MRAKTINEIQNFERGSDPKDSMKIGLWQELDEEQWLKISIEDLLIEKVVLEKGREIWAFDQNIWPYGFYTGKNDKDGNPLVTQEDLMKGFNPKFKKSFPVDISEYAVKVPTKIMYR